VTRVELALVIRGDDPAILQLADLGIGRGWRAGDPVLASRTQTHRTGGWELESDRPLTAPLRAHVQAVLDATASTWLTVRSAAAAGECVLSVALYVTAGPELEGTDIGPGQVSRLAELGASLDFDIYQFVPEREGR
jgi:hypothetical protein